MRGGYVDGFVFPVPKKNIKAYKKMASEAAEIWTKFGALEYYECMGEDLKIKAMPGMPKQRSFPELSGTGKSETTWFSFIVFKNRKHRDQVNKKVMDFFSKKYAGKEDMQMPFDVARMAYGGFKTEVSA
jgi:uncharacterized protein YbaA (DUF1428 family)